MIDNIYEDAKKEYVLGSKIRNDLKIIPILDILDQEKNYQMISSEVKDYIWFDELPNYKK